MKALERTYPKQKTGHERIHADGRILGPALLDFWQWSLSDLLSNATRGLIAEFLVATALGVDLHQPREEWGAYDLCLSNGTTVEVKSAAYLQSWHQDKLSKISFNIPRTKAWTSDTNQYAAHSKRQADVYVFALLAHTDKATVDPLNVCQWKFYVAPTGLLNRQAERQKTIGLSRLERITGPAIGYAYLAATVQEHSKRNAF